MFTTSAAAGDQGEAAAGIQPALSFNDRHDRYDPLTSSQRQQRTLPYRQDERPSTPSSHRALRRTPHFLSSPSSTSSSPLPDSPRRAHLEAVTVGFSPPALLATAGTDSPEPVKPASEVFPRQLSQDFSDDLGEASTPPPFFVPRQSPRPSSTRPEPHPIVHLSSHTKSAILWALEEALRQPHPFSPDPIEENASMADLLGSGPATTNGNGAPSLRPTAPPAQTGSPQQVIRGPRMIMRERAEREARQKAEREQMERIRAEEEARLLEEARRATAGRRVSAAGAFHSGDAPTDPATQRRQQRAQEAQGGSRVPASAPSAPAQPSSDMPPPLRPTRVPTSTQPPQGFNAAPQPGVGASAPPQTGEPSTQAAGSARVKNSFPHAFERWEALSAHWEGMTSFWIRKLQENTEELDRNPISAQLSRQVGDLSAAGANLFHAVVELQRLRASSERKFQRWFFETRSEIERLQEVNAMMENQMQEERQNRADAIRDAVNRERENNKTQKLLAEMRKELLISKEEARRAWEELGRREQEERDRTISLQQGHPTIVGGVQVVPMTQGVPSRQTSTRDRSHSQAETPDYGASQSSQKSQYPQYTQAPATQPSAVTNSPAGPSGGYYQHPSDSAQAHHDTGSYGAGSEAGYSEGEYVIDAQGNFAVDEHGNRIPYRTPPPQGARGPDHAAEEFDAPASQVTPTTSYPPSSSQWAGNYTGTPEYSGQGYAAPGWETLPRHHHPTRLSDVMEEDERSRTSASQVSRA